QRPAAGSPHYQLGEATTELRLAAEDQRRQRDGDAAVDVVRHVEYIDLTGIVWPANDPADVFRQIAQAHVAFVTTAEFSSDLSQQRARHRFFDRRADRTIVRVDDVPSIASESR